jgi:hypothetical protein
MKPFTSLPGLQALFLKGRIENDQNHLGFFTDSVLLRLLAERYRGRQQHNDSTPIDTQEGNDIASGVDAADSDLPRRMAYSDDGHRLITGVGERKSYYDSNYIGRIDLTFSQTNWWSQMVANYQSETEIPAAMSYDGIPLSNNVGVRFKGFTSYSQNKTEKKSFNISVDYENTEQDINGYQNLNLNCAFQDDTFMREVLLETVSQYYAPTLANNYVDLYINGEYWGIYINSQQIDGDFLKECSCPTTERAGGRNPAPA